MGVNGSDYLVGVLGGDGGGGFFWGGGVGGGVVGGGRDTQGVKRKKGPFFLRQTVRL